MAELVGLSVYVGLPLMGVLWNPLEAEVGDSRAGTAPAGVSVRVPTCHNE